MGQTMSAIYFVVFSSVVVAIENIGQSFYSSANYFLDTLVDYCACLWTAVSVVGMTAATVLPSVLTPQRCDGMCNQCVRNMYSIGLGKSDLAISIYSRKRERRF